MKRIMTIVLMIALVVSSLSVAYGDTGVVTFKDKNLESAIKEFFKANYHDYYDGTGALTKEVMEQINTLVIQEDKGITSLDGMEQFKNLKVLWIQNNSIKDLKPIAGLIKLNSLVLSNNNIESIEALQDLIELQTLDIRDNRITDIRSLNKLNKLERLNISNNNISDIGSLEGKTELKSFESYGNSEIEDISTLKDSLKLEFLVIVDSKIKDIRVLEDKVRLSHLALIDANIEDIKSLKDLKGLKDLYLTGNNIKDISPLLPFDRFEMLNLDNNPLWKDDGTNSMLGEVTGEKLKYGIDDKSVYEVWSEPVIKAVMITEGNFENKTDNSVLPIIITTVSGLFIILFIIINNKNIKIYAVENSNDTWGVRILGKRRIKVHSEEISIDISKELSEVENEKLKIEFNRGLAIKLLDKKILFIKDNNRFGEMTLTKLANTIEITKDGKIAVS